MVTYPFYVLNIPKRLLELKGSNWHNQNWSKEYQRLKKNEIRLNIEYRVLSERYSTIFDKINHDNREFDFDLFNMASNPSAEDEIEKELEGLSERMEKNRANLSSVKNNIEKEVKEHPLTPTMLSQIIISLKYHKAKALSLEYKLDKEIEKTIDRMFDRFKELIPSKWEKMSDEARKKNFELKYIRNSRYIYKGEKIRLWGQLKQYLSVLKAKRENVIKRNKRLIPIFEIQFYNIKKYGVNER